MRAKGTRTKIFVLKQEQNNNGLMILTLDL